MKGIILVGGSGTRLYPNNKIGKQTAAADIRQTHDLLSPLCSHACGDKGDGSKGDRRRENGGKGNELLELPRKISAMLYNYIKVRKERF